MSLDSGRQLGIYTIVGPLGAGGMGEVYRATDCKLDREVAIKVLPAALAYDKERVARFEREAKVLAQLNHPRIAAIYGFDEAEGKRFLVLELVEGPTLADRLATGRLPVEECLDIARQIAEALEVAHDKGIIHRDLKPANVKVTAEGEVKVLDFGLAKALAEDDTNVDPGDSPTITKDFTAPGVILGTAAYMSPEQARGRPVDKRADIWALGVVLYECLTGDSVFRGETVTDSLGAILHKQPDWNRLPAATPPTVQLLLRRCLAKDRKRRLRDIGDVRIELEAAIADPDSSVLGLASAPSAASVNTPLWSLRGMAAVVCVALVAVSVTIGITRLFWPTLPLVPQVEALPPAPVERFTITLPQRESIASLGSYDTFDVAGNGTVLAYMTAKSPNGVDAFLRWRDKVVPNIIATSDNRDGLRLPTLSPDGKWLAYYDKIARKLLKKSVLGGPATTLCQGIAVVGVAWADDGFITFTDGNRPDLLLRVSEDGGEVTELKIPASEEKWFRIVHALPGGKAILYSAFESKYAAGHGSIGVYSLETGQAKELVQQGTYPLYAHSGHLLFLLDSKLMAVPLDTKALETTGPVVPLPGLGDVSSGPYGSALFDITSSGTLYYREAETRRNANGIYRYAIESGGKPELISPRTGIYDRFSISFDAKFIAIEIGNLNEWIDWKANSIWVLDLRRDVLQRLTTEAGGQLTPMFSPDGVWVYYSAFDEDGEWKGIYRRRRGDSSIDGAEPIEEGPRQFFVFSISSDGMHLLGAEAPDSSVSPGTYWDIGLISLGENGENATRTTWAVGPSGLAQPSISPDGRYVAYTSWDANTGSNANTGSTEVYVRPFNSIEESKLEYQVSNNGGLWPMWSPDGKTLYYVEGKDQSKLMAATVLTSDGPTGDGKLSRFEIGEVKELFGFGSFALYGQEHVTIMPDGSGFLRSDVVRQEGDKKISDDLAVIHVVRNFFTELKRVAATEKDDANR